MERNDRHTEYNPEQEMTRTGDEKPIGAVGQRERRPKSRAARAAQDVITGDFMGDSRLRRWYPLALYCILLVFLYIGHVFNFQRLQRLEIQQRMELNNERSRSMVFSSMRMNASRHSRIVEEIERRSETRRVHGTAQNSPVSTGKKTGIAAGTQATHSTRPKRQRRRARQCHGQTRETIRPIRTNRISREASCLA